MAARGEGAWRAWPCSPVPLPVQFFPLLKSTEKLYAQDQIWKKICKDLRWEFIPSV